MKLIISVIAGLVLIASTACSKEEPQAESPKADVTGIINTQTGRIDTAKKALEDSKQVNQAIQDSAAEQRETIEKTQQ